MAASAVAVRRKPVAEFPKPDEMERMLQRPARLPLALWLKMDAIARKQAKEGRISPYTKRKVSANDLLRSFVEVGLQVHEAEHGAVSVTLAEVPAEPAKKRAAKKGGK